MQFSQLCQHEKQSDMDPNEGGGGGGGRRGEGGVAHQIVLAMFGPQHGRHLGEVGGVAALLSAGGETEGDDSLCDVDQVHLIALLHGLDHTLTPGGGTQQTELIRDGGRSASAG